MSPEFFILGVGELKTMILQKALRAFLKRREAGILRHYKAPILLQERVFNHLIQYGITTRFGRRHHFSSIRTIADFKNRVPIHRYEDLLPYFQSILQGESSVLWPGRVSWFAKSSGSTDDRSKYIPVTRESLYQCHYKAAKDVMALYLFHNPFSRIFEGKGFILGGSSALHPASRFVRAGDLSAVLLHNSPWYSRIIRTPSNAIALMDNWEKKMEALIRILPRQKVTSLSGVPSWMLVLLERILAAENKENFSTIWPALELYIHGAVNFAPYRERFRKIFEGLTVYFLETYNASEGFFALQDQPGSEDLLLLLDHGVFYEFVPLEELASENPRTYHLGEVETGRQYALVISTNGGLWRYLIGDTIRFTSLYPFRIRITGRTRHFINVFGEELMVENAEQAIARASARLGASVRDFTAGPVYMKEGKAGAHEWFIEFSKTPDSLDQFRDVLDEELRLVNSDYDAKRRGNLALGPPIIHAVPPGTFDRWLKKHNKLGGQHKVPRLSNERKILEELREFL